MVSVERCICISSFSFTNVGRLQRTDNQRRQVTCAFSPKKALPDYQPGRVFISAHPSYHEVWRKKRTTPGQNDPELYYFKISSAAESNPRDQEVYQFLLEHWRKLQFSPAVAGGLPPEAIRNPKRRQREVQLETRTAGIGTKAQQALKLQQEQGKLERKVRSRQEKEAEEARRFQLRQEKRREKHRGH